MLERYERMNHICLLFLAGTVFTLVLYATKSVMIPFAFAVFVFAVISPILHNIQSKWKIPRVAAIAITVFGVLIASAITFALMSMSVKGFMHSADLYRDKVQLFAVKVTELFNNNGLSIDAEFVKSELKQVLGVAGHLTSSVLNIVGDFVLVVIFVLFMVGGSGSAKSQNHIVAEIQQKVFEYVTYKFLLSLATGILVGVILASFSVDLAFLIAVLTIWLNFIPNFGSLLATLLPIPVILVEFGFDWRLGAILAIVGGVQFLIGNVLEPKLLGESMDLHPVTILFFLMFWGLVWGVPGMFLAVPFTVILKIVLARLEATKSLSELMAGRFA
jgi:AI-2 transport protein TqsA